VRRARSLILLDDDEEGVSTPKGIIPACSASGSHVPPNGSSFNTPTTPFEGETQSQLAIADPTGVSEPTTPASDPTVYPQPSSLPEGNSARPPNTERDPTRPSGAEHNSTQPFLPEHDSMQPSNPEHQSTQSSIGAVVALSGNNNTERDSTRPSGTEHNSTQPFLPERDSMQPSNPEHQSMQSSIGAAVALSGNNSIQSSTAVLRPHGPLLDANSAQPPYTGVRLHPYTPAHPNGNTSSMDVIHGTFAPMDDFSLPVYNSPLAATNGNFYNGMGSSHGSDLMKPYDFSSEPVFPPVTNNTLTFDPYCNNSQSMSFGDLYMQNWDNNSRGNVGTHANFSNLEFYTPNTIGVTQLHNGPAFPGSDATSLFLPPNSTEIRPLADKLSDSTPMFVPTGEAQPLATKQSNGGLEATPTLSQNTPDKGEQLPIPLTEVSKTGKGNALPASGDNKREMRSRKPKATIAEWLQSAHGYLGGGNEGDVWAQCVALWWKYESENSGEDTNSVSGVVCGHIKHLLTKLLATSALRQTSPSRALKVAKPPKVFRHSYHHQPNGVRHYLVHLVECDATGLAQELRR